jgi:DNA-binding transcriptional ArsR family regulator
MEISMYEQLQPIFKAWFVDFTTRVNKYLRKYNVPLTCISPLDLTLDDVNAYMTAGGPPQIYDNEIESAVIMLVKTTDINPLFRPANGLYSAVNAVQGGKNGSCIIFLWLKRLWCHLHGQDCEFLYVCPGDTTIEEMTVLTYHKLVKWLQVINLKNSSNDIKNYGFLITNGDSDNAIAKDGGFKPHIWSMTNKASLKHNIIERMNAFASQGKTLVTIWDETHVQENKLSIADAIFGVEVRQRFANQNHQILFVSATPFTYHWSKYVEPIYLKLGPTYTGFNMINGHIIDSDVAIVTPYICCFDDLQGADLIPIYPKAAFSVKALAKCGREYGIDWQDLGVSNCETYFTLMMQRINRIFRHYVNLGKTGFCARFINNDEHTQKIIVEIQKEFGGKIRIIKYTQEMSYKDLQEMISHCVQNKIMFIIVVTAKGRMSNRFPKAVQVFMDYTWKYSTAAAMIQGLAGRAAIYGEPRTVILSAHNKKLLDVYVNSKGKEYKLKPHARAIKDKEKIYQNLSFYVRDAKSKILFDNVSRILGKIVAKQCARIRDEGGRPRGQWVPFDTLLPPSVMQHLEKLYACHLLRLDEIPTYYAKDVAESGDDTSYRYNNTLDPDKVFVAFRTNDSNGLRSARSEKQTNSMKQSLGKKRGIEPHISIDVKTGKITHIDLALASPLKVQIGENPEALPTSIFDNHFPKKAQ